MFAYFGLESGVVLECIYHFTPRDEEERKRNMRIRMYFNKCFLLLFYSK